jgi:hypothetical protein
MYKLLLPFVTLLLAGLLAGAVGLDWLLNQIVNDPALYIGFKQLEIPALTATLVPLGLVTMVLALLQAYANRQRRLCLWLTLAGAAGMLAMGLLTRFVFFPLNDQIITWSPQLPPTDWHAVRAQWNGAQSLRTVIGLGSFALLLLAALAPQQQNAEAEASNLVRGGPRRSGEEVGANLW